MTALDAFGPRSWAQPEATGFGRLPMSTHLVRPDELALDGTVTRRARQYSQA